MQVKCNICFMIMDESRKQYHLQYGHELPQKEIDGWGIDMYFDKVAAAGEDKERNV